VGFEVLNVAGRVVAAIPDRRYDAGAASVAFDGHGADGARLAAGVYFLRMRVADRAVGLTKFTLLR
jgi:hypothetical protein